MTSTTHPTTSTKTVEKTQTTLTTQPLVKDINRILETNSEINELLGKEPNTGMMRLQTALQNEFNWEISITRIENALREIPYYDC